MTEGLENVSLNLVIGFIGTLLLTVVIGVFVLSGIKLEHRHKMTEKRLVEVVEVQCDNENHVTKQHYDAGMMIIKSEMAYLRGKFNENALLHPVDEICDGSFDDDCGTKIQEDYMKKYYQSLYNAYDEDIESRLQKAEQKLEKAELEYEAKYGWADRYPR